MSPIAFVLIDAKLGSENVVLGALKKVSGVKEAYIVYGDYDIIAKIQADTSDELKEIVTLQVRRMEEVHSTLTMIVTEE